MKIGLISDLHIEFWKSRKEHPILSSIRGDYDILLIAGDIFCTNKRTKENKEINFLQRKYFIKALKLLVDVPVHYILGNHDYWYELISNEEKEDENNLTNKSIVYKDITFIGCTLWSRPEKDKEYYLRNFSDCQFVPNFNLEKYKSLHEKDILFLKEELKKVETEKVVVLTHHAPTLKATNLKFIGNINNSMFSSNLEGFIETYNPDLWCFGHHHNVSDFSINKTRIVCNPYGYPEENRSPFLKVKIIEI